MIASRQLTGSDLALVEASRGVLGRRDRLDGRIAEGALPSLRELALASFLLLALAVAVFGSHIMRGTFYYDDWSNAARSAYPPKPGFFGSLEAYWHVTGYRPLLALYLPVLHAILGTHQHMQLAWAVLLAVFMAVSLFALLSTLGLQRIHALAISALALVFPASDATRLWATSATASLVIGMYLWGLVLALRGLAASDRRARAWYHAGALVLFLAAISMYELVATVALVSVAFYVWRGGLRRALKLFALDASAIALLLAFTLSKNKIDKATSFGESVDHARAIFDQGLSVIATSAEPFGVPSRTPVLAVLLAAMVSGGLVWWRLPSADPARRSIGSWLALAVAATLWTWVAWAVFVPAAPYYTPGRLGVGNRVNALADIGVVTAVYAVAMLVASILCRLLNARGRMATALGLLAAVALGIGYVREIDHDKLAWDLASRWQNRVLGVLRQQVPRPPAGATVYTFDYPSYTAPGVPTFASSWDLNGAVKLLYHRFAISGYPVIAGVTMICAAHGLYPSGAGYTVRYEASYGLAYLVDVGTGRVAVPRTSAECRREIRAFAPGPFELSAS
jgi:hypothetical protein